MFTAGSYAGLAVNTFITADNTPFWDTAGSHITDGKSLGDN